MPWGREHRWDGRPAQGGNCSPGNGVFFCGDGKRQPVPLVSWPQGNRPGLAADRVAVQSQGSHPGHSPRTPSDRRKALSTCANAWVGDGQAHRLGSRSSGKSGPRGPIWIKRGEPRAAIESLPSREIHLQSGGLRLLYPSHQADYPGSAVSIDSPQGSIDDFDGRIRTSRVRRAPDEGGSPVLPYGRDCRAPAKARPNRLGDAGNLLGVWFTSLSEVIQSPKDAGSAVPRPPRLPLRLQAARLMPHATYSAGQGARLFDETDCRDPREIVHGLPACFFGNSLS